MSNSIGLIKCQQCLNDLIKKESFYLCNSCNQKYLFDRDILFMGYDKKNKLFIEKIIKEETEHQADLNCMEKSKEFAEYSYKTGYILSQLIKKIINPKGLHAIDIGSGGAPMSRFLADIGFAVYSCELEPNSLLLAHKWKKDAKTQIKSITCDATLLPFADNSIDLVFSKEFFHHIKDYNHIFNETNRVLKPGGLLILKEPTTRFKFILTTSEKESISLDYHHIVTNYQYYKAFKKNGFKIKKYYLWYGTKSRIKPLNAIRKYLDNQVLSASKTSGMLLPFKLFYQRICSGSNIFIAEKRNHIKKNDNRPLIENVDRKHLVLENHHINDPRLEIFTQIFEKVKQI